MIGRSHLDHRDRRVILLIDQDPAILQVRKLIFEVLGYAVLTACSRRDALECLRQARVDLVVLDDAMPEMNGVQTARVIRRLHGGILIVLSATGNSVPESVLKIVDSAVDKARLQALVVVVGRLLETASRGRQPATVKKVAAITEG
jgi:CheY-like chemotaxis protein